LILRDFESFHYFFIFAMIENISSININT